MLIWFWRLVCCIGWALGDLDSLKLLAINFLAVRQNYEIIAAAVREEQGGHGDQQIGDGAPFREVHGKRLGLGNDVIVPQINHVYRDRILPDAIGELQENRKGADVNGKMMHVPVGEDADDAYFSRPPFHDRVIAEQDRLASGWWFTLPGFAFGHESVPGLGQIGICPSDRVVQGAIFADRRPLMATSVLPEICELGSEYRP